MKWNQILLGVGFLLSSLSAVEARTVFWGSPTGAVLYQSNGTTPVDDTFTFLLGSFAQNFNPLTAGLETWASNWHTFDQAYYNMDTNFFESTAIMSETGTSNGVNADANFDFRSQRLYLWVFNSNYFNPTEVTTNESALFTGDTWVLPDVGNPCCGEDNLPLQLYVSNMTTAITGNVDPDFDGEGPPIVGPIGSATPPGQTYDFQTHSITVVPEPSVALLSGLSLLGLALRRRRS